MHDRWTAVQALADPSRRALYDYVRRQSHPVSREEAGAAVRMSRNLAAFHLDKLVESGLLRADYEAPRGQRRGRGRTPKVYRVTEDSLAITVPERRYELIAEILADAIAEDPAAAQEAADRHAQRRGRDIGSQLRGVGLLEALIGLGFEPEEAASGTVLLHNCPFHRLAARQTALVCGLNVAFLTGLVEGLDIAGLRAELRPAPGFCCVELQPERDR